MMKKFIMMCLAILGMAGTIGAQEVRKFKDNCGNVTTYSADEPFIKYIERTLKWWALTGKDNGKWASDTILTESVARRLPPDYYFVDDSDVMVELTARTLGTLGPKGAFEYATGSKTVFNRAKCGEAPKLVTITAEINRKAAELNLSNANSYLKRNGDEVGVIFPDEGKEIWQNTATGTLCVIDVKKSEETTCRDSVEWRGKFYYKSELLCDTVFIDSTFKVVYFHDLNIVPVPDIPKELTLKHDKDSALVGDRYVYEPGFYPYVIHGVCDTTIMYLVSQKGCEPCVDDHRRWLQMGPVAVGAFARYEILPSNWQRKLLYGGEIIGEYKFINGLLFKNPCWGESLRLSLAISSVNKPFPKPGGCLECNNVDDADNRMLIVDLKYYISWLKGYPYIVSIGLGPVMRYHRIEGYKPVEIGIGSSVEGEWFAWEQLSIYINGGVDYFPITLKFVPNIRGGIRVWPIKGRTEPRA